MNDRFYSIRQLSKEFGVSYRTLRFYETRGLLEPKRVIDGQEVTVVTADLNKSAKRLYSERDRQNLKALIQAKEMGFSLTEAAAMKHDQGVLVLDGETIAKQIAYLTRYAVEVNNQLKALNTLYNEVRPGELRAA